MAIWVFLTVSALVLAAPNCNNPLFSTANWPTAMQRPRYLTTPQAFTPNTTFCGKFMSDSTTQTCCDQTAVDDIVSMFKTQKDLMKKKGEGLEGGVRDTFNDFDPANQKAKGVAVPTGGARLLQAPPAGQTGTTGAAPGGQTGQPTGTPPQGTNGVPPQGTNGAPPQGTTGSPPQGTTGSAPQGSTGTPPQGSTGTPPQGSTGTPPQGATGTQGATPQQGQNNTSTSSAGKPMGPPPRQDRPEGFNNFDVPATNLTARSPPQGRGTEKNRPGLLKMSATAQQTIGNITRDMSALMQQFAHDMGKCMMAQLKHLAGMLCMGCDPNWESWVSGTTASITVSLKDTACDEMTSACLDFIKESQNLPALIAQMKASIQTVIDSEIAAGTIKAADVPTDDLANRTKPPAQVAAVCTTDSACRTYICETMSKGNGGVAPDPSTVADPASVSTTKTRLLAASVTYQFTSSGYDSVSLGATSTASSAQTSTTGSFIDGVSTEAAPLSTATGSVLAVACLFLISLIH